MATSPAFASNQFTRTLGVRSCSISTANTNKDGVTGTYGTLITSVTGGILVLDIRIVATSNTTAGMVRFFEYCSNGPTSRLLMEVPVYLVVPSASTPGWSKVLTDLKWNLPDSTYSIKCSTHNTEAFDITVTRVGAY